MTRSDVDTIVWLLCLVVAALCFGAWQRSAWAGMFLFTAALAWLSMRTR